MATAEQILDLHSGFRSFGYALVAEQIEGEEELYVQTYRAVLSGLADSLSVINRQYRTRGKSKAALAILHTRRPEPAWGVEVSA
jgi:predicted deacylase